MLSASPVSLIAVAGLAAITVGMLLLAAFYPQLYRRRQLARRIELISKSPKAAGRSDPGADQAQRRRSLEATLRELEEEQKAKVRQRAKPTLTVRMRQAGLRWSVRTYYSVAIAAGLLAFLLCFGFFGVGPLPALGFGLAGGLLLPHIYVSTKRNSRLKRFGAEFPNALDVVVRGVKAGLPLVDCMRIVATEAQEPVRTEFQMIQEDQTLGMPLDEAVQRLAERMPTAEARFFAIVIAIQSRTGGSLSEALGNLSKVLRERKKMSAKVKAMSSEAKSSAGIIGALPVVVGFLVYLTSPDYILLLFTMPLGNAVLAISGMWMGLGILVMRKMINFEF